MKIYQKKLRNLTLCVMVALTTLPTPLGSTMQEAHAETKQLDENIVYADDYGYTVKTDGTIRLVEYQGEKSLETYRIPETVDGKEVSELGTNLYNGLHVKEMTIAGHIKHMKTETFTDSRIDKLIMDDANETEAVQFIYKNTTIGEIEFKNTTKIGNSLFSGATIEKFELPESIEEVEAYAFFGTNITGDITVNAEKPYGEGVFFMATVNGDITITNMTDKEKEYENWGDNPYFQLFNRSMINGDVTITNSDYIGYQILSESEINGEVSIAGENTVLGNHLFRNSKVQKVSMTGTITNITDNSFLNTEVVEPMIIEADVEKIGFSHLPTNYSDNGTPFINTILNGLTFKGKVGKINESSFISGNIGELRLEKGLDVGYRYSFNGVGLTNVQIIGHIGTLNGYTVLNSNEDTIDYDVTIQGNIQNYGGYNNDLGIREEGSGNGNSNGVFTGSRNITINGNVQNIGEKAFMNTNEIKNDSIIINGNVGRIGTEAFQGNKGKLEINGNVGHIMRIAFLVYEGDVTIQGDVAEIGSLNHRDEYETILTSYKGNFKVLGDIRKIHDNGMANYGSVYDLYVGGDIPYVGQEGLAYVSKIQVDGDVVEIGNRAFIFYGKEEGEIVNKVPKSIFKGVTKIGEDAFRYNEVEDDIVFPETLQEIGDNAFNGVGLTKVKLPKGLQYLGTGAFTQNSLACITIPKGITKIEMDEILQKDVKPIDVYGTEAKGHKQAYGTNAGVTFIENSVFTNNCDNETWGVKVIEQTTSGDVLNETYIEKPKEGNLDIEATTHDGYVLKDTAKKQITITEDEPNHVVTFTYEKIQSNGGTGGGTGEKPPVIPEPPVTPEEPPVAPEEPPVTPEEPEEKPSEPTPPTDGSDTETPPVTPNEPTETLPPNKDDDGTDDSEQKPTLPSQNDEENNINTEPIPNDTKKPIPVTSSDTKTIEKDKPTNTTKKNELTADDKNQTFLGNVLPRTGSQTTTWFLYGGILLMIVGLIITYRYYRKPSN